MKTLYFLLASVQLSLAAPASQVNDDSECACPMPLCPPGQPERCECQNAAIDACWSLQLEDGKDCPAPALKDCNSTSTGLESPESTSFLSTDPAPTSPQRCSCAPAFCAQIWPQSCHCANNAKLQCHKNCGGVLEELQDCGDTLQQSASLYSAFALPTGTSVVSSSDLETLEPTQTSEPTLTFERPSAIPSAPSESEPTCQCEPAFCIQSWPAGCHCMNKAKLDCYDNCGGPYPELQVCGSDPDETPSPEDLPQSTDAPIDATSTNDLEDFPQFTDAPVEIPSDPDTTPAPPSCRCDPVFCAQSWPLSCQCSNQAASDCAQLCGRPEPQFLDCNGPGPDDIQSELPNLFDMIPDPNDIPVIFTNLIPDLPDPQELPDFLENLPDYINEIPDDEPWTETHNWFSFLFPDPTPAPELPETSVHSYENEEVPATPTIPTVSTPAITTPAAPNYRVCGHRAADPCPTGYNCVSRPGAHCGPEVDCGGYCVDILNESTLLADAPTASPASTLSNTTTLSFSMITDLFPSTYSPSTLSTRRAALPPRQVTDTPASTPSNVLSQTPCGDGYPPCDPGLECVDMFVNGIGFAEKRSYCAVGPAAIAGGSVVGDADIPPFTPDAAIPSSSSTSSTPDDLAPSPIWPDTAWPGPITTLVPLFGPGPVGISLLTPSSSSSSPDPTTVPPVAPIPAPLQTWTPSTTDGGPAPTPLTLQCGGPAAAACPDGLACVRDLSAPGPLGGCGPGCGEVGVCIVPETCGGFVGKACSEPGRTCVDQPGDGCDPAEGGADCMGICV